MELWESVITNGFPRQAGNSLTNYFTPAWRERPFPSFMCLQHVIEREETHEPMEREDESESRDLRPMPCLSSLFLCDLGFHYLFQSTSQDIMTQPLFNHCFLLLISMVELRAEHICLEEGNVRRLVCRVAGRLKGASVRSIFAFRSS